MHALEYQQKFRHALCNQLTTRENYQNSTFTENILALKYTAPHDFKCQIIVYMMNWTEV